MKTPEAARRPGFPLRLKPDTGLPSATKNIANNARIESPKGLNDNNNVLQKPVPAGLGQDSLAVRTRMVQKLAAQGLADPQVLAAMGLIERLNRL